MRPMKRVGVSLAIVLALGGCGLFGGKEDKRPKTPVIGKRVPILSGESAAEVDKALEGTQVVVPPPATNDAWAQSGGNAAKSMGHPNLGLPLGQAWSVSIGKGGNNRARLAAGPVVAENRVYTIDTTATVRAFTVANGSTVWETQLADGKTKDNPSLFGGGVAYEDGKVFATNGVGQVAALEASTGKVLWKVRPAGPLRGAPTLAFGNVFVVTQDNQLFALSAADGSQVWNASAAGATAGVFGVAAPAAGQGTIVAGFSSGELNAYRYENGRSLWQDSLSRTSISTAVAALADVDADPVIDNGVVYAVGQGGRMVALELTTGQRQWEINLAGIRTPWVAGDWLFVITDDARLMCIARATGKVRWISILPRWDNEKKKKGYIGWTAPVLAGGRLILASSDGRMANIDPETGSIQNEVKVKGSVSLSPVVANDTLFILTDDGRLSAWR
ncbi:PQQ-binding-like beta-propeller repeat protein [Sphingomonas sp. ID0503]|uniref:outer membrane protein assembly factor BamB family protein n=1 Tax=Sphingomonas sp. ID0503 TaxID=3399691 RepID=UPI003AFA9EB3